MKSLIIILLSGASLTAAGQKYNASLIPDSLTKNADVVERYDETTIEIKDAGHAKLYQKHVYTILGESGDEFAGYVTAYDKFNEINSIDGNLYDAAGKQLKNVKKKDISDLSGTDDESLMTDRRYKKHNFYYRIYPYTVEYEEDDDLNGILQLPEWFPQGSNVMSVEYSKYVITTPKNLPIRYKQFNFPGQPAIKEDDGRITYTWEIRNLPARVEEPYQPSWRKICPLVKIAPTDFEIQGYKGNMSTWENFGTFINSLMQGREVLTPEIKAKVHELTDGIADPHEKVKTLYNFLQQNTRYISIQLGIGGWQPFDATYVITKKYGDCKALSNYMVALLTEAGIHANYVLIRAGENAADIITDFPSNQFNHATVCVPFQSDTMWLECTNQTIPAGYIGDFTSNRHALLIDEKGGHIVATTRYTAEDNRQIRVVEATVDEAGKMDCQVKTRYSCMQEDLYHAMVNGLTKDKLKDYLNKMIDLPDYDVVQFNYAETKQQKPFIDEKLQIVANNYATVSGKRMFLTPNLMSKYTTKLLNTEPRKYDIVFSYPFTDIDTVDITIPAGYTVESMPKDVTLKNKFGAYEAHFAVSGDKVTFTRYYKHDNGTFPSSDYDELVKFLGDIYKADRSKIVFVKNEN